MEYLHKIKVHDARISVILANSGYPSNARPDAPLQAEPFHEHPIFELFFIKKGSIELHTPSDARTYSNCIVLIPPHVRHRTAPQDCDVRVICFMSEPKYESEAAACNALIKAIGTKIVALPFDDAPRFYIDRLYSTTTSEEIPHLLSLLFSTLLSAFNIKALHAHEPDFYRTKYITTTEQFIANNAYRKVHLADLAAELSLSEKQCARLLKKHFGSTLSELIHKARMEIASIKLKYTDHDVSDIAHSLGYEYENYFFTVFRKHFGLTPSEYRSAELKKLNRTPLADTNHHQTQEDVWTS